MVGTPAPGGAGGRWPGDTMTAPDPVLVVVAVVMLVAGFVVGAQWAANRRRRPGLPLPGERP